MTDRTFLFRLVGDSRELIAAIDSADKAIDGVGAKAGAAGQAAAKGFEANGVAAKAAAAHVEGFSFATAGAKRELLVLAHEL
ncbi:MAG: hypothetical protein ABI460_16535, partial [Caldimonas sp.]